MVEQAAEAVAGAAVLVVLAGCLGPGAWRTGGGADGVAPAGRVLVGVGQGCPGTAQVPDQVAGEHADQDVGADAFFEPVVDGPQVQVVGFDVAEVPLDVFEVLVGGDHGGASSWLAGTAVRNT